MSEAVCHVSAVRVDDFLRQNLIVSQRALGEPFFSLFSPLRREKILRLKNPGARLLSAAAELALLTALRMADPVFLPPARYEYSPSGQPRLLPAWGGPSVSAKDSSAFPDGLPFISLSHSGEWALAAVSSAPVGADIEGKAASSPALARRCLSDREMEEYLASPDPAARFRSLWVAKESYVKLTGEGLSRPFREVEVALSPGPVARISIGAKEYNITTENMGQPSPRGRDGANSVVLPTESVCQRPLFRFQLDGYEAALCAREPVKPILSTMAARDALDALPRP